jgi:hypothetical protein
MYVFMCVDIHMYYLNLSTYRLTSTPPGLQIEYQVEDTSFAEGGGTSRGTGNEAGDKDRSHSEHGLTCISWNDCPFEPAKLAVGGYSKVARVYTLEGNTLQQVPRQLCI